MQEAKKIIQSAEYENLIKFVEDKILLKILNDYRDNAAARDEDKLNKANASSEDILKIITLEKTQFIKYLFAKIKQFENVKFKDDFPEGEEIEEEEDNETILGYAKGFILLYAIEFFLLKNGDNQKIETWLKECRVPQSKRYAKQLLKIYKSISSN